MTDTIKGFWGPVLDRVLRRMEMDLLKESFVRPTYLLSDTFDLRRLQSNTHGWKLNTYVYV